MTSVAQLVFIIINIIIIIIGWEPSPERRSPVAVCNYYSQDMFYFNLFYSIKYKISVIF